MAVQTDVKSTYLTAAGSVFGGPTRVRGFVCSGKASTAATFEIRDGGATGTIVFQYSIPSNANMNSFSIQFPGDGIRCSTDAYVTFSVGSVTCLSVFYG
mgnify:FL=1